jgi:acetyl-CoA carboxylase carboxyltransferase component
MTRKPELDELTRREALAREMGGIDKVKRQHDHGRLTTRERIVGLINKNSFHEIGGVSALVNMTGRVNSSAFSKAPAAAR